MPDGRQSHVNSVDGDVSLVAACVQEGVTALWRGWVPSVIGVIPYVGLNFAVYETLKDGVIQMSGVFPIDCDARHCMQPGSALELYYQGSSHRLICRWFVYLPHILRSAEHLGKWQSAYQALNAPSSQNATLMHLTVELLCMRRCRK